MAFARHRVPIVFAAVAVAALLAAVLVVSLGSGRSTPRREAATGHAPVTDVAAPPGPTGSWKPVPPSTTVPTSTPVQQQYDQGFEQGFTSAANRQTIASTESLTLPSPATTGGWPALAGSDSPETWTREFVRGLLDVDFAHQSRMALGSWLVAEEAPDLMPGIPAKAQLSGLYATVMAPQVTGLPSPVPSAAQWQQNAAAHVRWAVTGLEVQTDPQWQSMIAAGWQPTDLYAAVEDVSGVLHINRGGSNTTRTFSLVVQLGSAHWHHGYGAALVSGWKES